MTKISIIVPVYNVEKYIFKCLDSIANQTFTDFEVLCVDDFGTDNSMEIVRDFAKKDDRFKIFDCGSNQGVSVARNLAMDKAQGEYIFFADSDDWLEITAFEKVINTFEKTNADSVWFDFNVYKDDKHKCVKAVISDPDADGFYDITPENIVECPIYIWNKAYKASLLKELNVKFPAGLYFQDSEFYFRIFTRLTKINYINEALYNYRVRPGSTVTRSQVENLERIEDMFKILYNMYDYAKENNIFDKYKWAFCKMIALRLNCHKLKNQHDKAIKLSYELLKRLDFPNSYLDFEK